MTAKCQYIAGEPTGLDSCKCLKPCKGPYCEYHAKLCIKDVVRKTKEEAMAGVQFLKRRGRI